METFHLRYFVAVAENLSFSRAARQLHMATSPLSRRVRDLEHELDVTLFDRDPHHVQLTGAGSALLPLAKDVLSRFDDLPWQLHQQLGAVPRTAYAGVAPGLHPQLREALRTAERSCPAGVELKRWPGSSADLLAAVQRGELAAALVHLPVHAEGIEVREVFREPLGAVVPAAEFGGRSAVRLSELVDHTYVRLPAGMQPTYFEQVQVRLQAAGIHRKITASSGDYGAVGEIVANGSAFSLTFLDPKSDMAKHRGENLAVLPFEDFDPELTTGLIWHRDRAENNSGLRELVEHVERTLLDVLGEPPRAE
ncbi:LysR family transcriptional regulator [Salinifilum ghardaiensis]